MPRKCLRCGTVNPDNARYCWNDGQILDQAAESPVIDPSKVQWEPEHIQFQSITPNSGVRREQFSIRNNGPGALKVAFATDDPDLIDVDPPNISENNSIVDVRLYTRKVNWGDKIQTSLKAHVEGFADAVEIPITIEANKLNEAVLEEFGELVKRSELITLGIGFITSWLVSGKPVDAFQIVLVISPTIAFMVTAFESLPWEKGYEVEWGNALAGVLGTGTVIIVLAIAEAINNAAEAISAAVLTIFFLSAFFLVITNLTARILLRSSVKYLTKNGVNNETKRNTIIKFNLPACIIGFILISL